MITVKVDIDWLDKVSGLTVAEAVEYLKTLPQSHKLSAYAVEINEQVEQYSGLYYEREETVEEVKAARIAYLKNRSLSRTKHIAYYQKQVELFENKSGKQGYYSKCLDRARTAVVAIEKELAELTK